MFRVLESVLIVFSVFALTHGQSNSCYTCTGEGLDSCALLNNRHVEQCRTGAVGCAIAAGVLPKKKDVVTVERTCLYVDPQQYCKKIKTMVGTQHEQDYYCWTCFTNRCNSGNITSFVNRLQPGPVTVDVYPENPTANPCKK